MVLAHFACNHGHVSRVWSVVSLPIGMESPKGSILGQDIWRRFERSIEVKRVSPMTSLFQYVLFHIENKI